MSTTTHGPAAATTADATRPEAPAPASDFGGDVQHLIGAVTRLAEAAARPVVRTLNVVGNNIGPQRTPRVRFRAIEEAGTELVVSTVRLAERVANLLLEVTDPEKPQPRPDGARAEMGKKGAVPGARGRTLRLPMSVENPSSTPMVDLAFQLTELRGPADTSLTAASICVVPEKVTVAPGDFEKVVVEVAIPADAAPGSYEAHLGLAGNADFASTFRFVVAA